MISSDLAEPSADLLLEQNAEKQSVSEEKLSAEQHEAIQKLHKKLTKHGLYNLVGPPESGKTILAWYLTAIHEDWSYFAWLPVKSDIEASVVVIDNAMATRAASRRAREVITFTEAKSVVVISETAIPEATEYVHLTNKT